ncbi:hypothetical protein [Streptomyces sp. NPDC048638]|uniref:hypothetical protein n=1 Tax=Streptomyces sp. NPDC048638 TaxID=3365580 RepID=UPI00371733A0
MSPTLMYPAARPVTITAAAVTAALLLTACTSSTPKPPPLEHGTVKKKDHDAARPDTPIYEDRYRETNCRTATTNALTLTGITRPSTGGTGGRSTTGGGSGGGSKSKPGTPNKLDKGNSSGSTGSGKSSRRVCDRTYLGRVQTGVHKHPAVWKVLIVKGKRSNWKTIATEEKWRKIKIGDRI